MASFSVRNELLDVRKGHLASEGVRIVNSRILPGNLWGASLAITQINTRSLRNHHFELDANPANIKLYIPVYRSYM